ncbi:unnamed protein product [Ranitomeya imitator]|uniref:Rab5 n=1 Tax=Ranitomeya imitator TaxID=111125 RepID=A0ABN9KWE2_9NEOB|nr:unnamed protein product [Ranitomeya imitator]
MQDLSSWGKDDSKKGAMDLAAGEPVPTKDRSSRGSSDAGRKSDTVDKSKGSRPSDPGAVVDSLKEYYRRPICPYTIMANRGGATRPNGPNAGNKICQFKLVLLGESAVGKSSLVLRFVKGQFHEFQESTIGDLAANFLSITCTSRSEYSDANADWALGSRDIRTLRKAKKHECRHRWNGTDTRAAFLTQTVCLDDTTVKFEIWDTAGQERYHSLAPMYYRGAQAAIVVYDITNEESFARAKNWVKELQRQASPNIVIALSGNKADLASKRAVDFQTGSNQIVNEMSVFIKCDCSVRDSYGRNNYGYG